jgi:hypothetical protein
MSKIDFVQICETLLEESLLEEQLVLLEQEVQQQSEFEQKINQVAATVNRIIEEAESAAKRKNPYGSINARKPELFNLRKNLKKLLDEGRQRAIAALSTRDPKKEYKYVPYSEDEVDNLIHKKVSEGGIFQYFGKLLSTQFGEEYFPKQK